MMNQEHDDAGTGRDQTHVNAGEALPEAPENEEQIGVSEQNTPSAEAPADDWKAKFMEMNDRFLRLYSEFDNYKKRNARERIEITKTAGADIISALLTVLDDFDRAAKAMESASDLQSIREGMQLIHHKFRAVLNQKGLEEMNSLGEPFNSDLHEAITSIPAPDEDQKGKVLDEVEKGYALNGKVIRFAKVVVGA